MYVIQHTLTKEKYIGYTSNLKSRLIRHNSSGNKSTYRKSNSWVLIYAEAYRSKTDAINRERRLKSHGSGKRELFKRLDSSWLET